MYDVVGADGSKCGTLTSSDDAFEHCLEKFEGFFAI
jgi:hypothetical protein